MFQFIWLLYLPPPSFNFFDPLLFFFLLLSMSIRYTKNLLRVFEDKSILVITTHPSYNILIIVCAQDQFRLHV